MVRFFLAGAVLFHWISAAAVTTASDMTQDFALPGLRLTMHIDEMQRQAMKLANVTSSPNAHRISLSIGDATYEIAQMMHNGRVLTIATETRTRNSLNLDAVDSLRQQLNKIYANEKPGRMDNGLMTHYYCHSENIYFIVYRAPNGHAQRQIIGDLGGHDHCKGVVENTVTTPTFMPRAPSGNLASAFPMKTECRTIVEKPQTKRHRTPIISFAYSIGLSPFERDSPHTAAMVRKGAPVWGAMDDSTLENAFSGFRRPMPDICDRDAMEAIFYSISFDAEMDPQRYSEQSTYIKGSMAITDRRLIKPGYVGAGLIGIQGDFLSRSTRDRFNRLLSHSMYVLFDQQGRAVCVSMEGYGRDCNLVFMKRSAWGTALAPSVEASQDIDRALFRFLSAPVPEEVRRENERIANEIINKRLEDKALRQQR